MTRHICMVLGCMLLAALVATSASDARPFDATDAELMALEFSGELTPPPDLVTRFESDLAMMRDEIPLLRDVYVTPPWVPSFIIVWLEESAIESFLDGTHPDLGPLNELYGPLEIQPGISPHIFYLIFEPLYHSAVLAGIYEAVDDVILAEPNGIIGHSRDITVEAIGRYLFWWGWGDCPAGCIENHFWRVWIEDGAVTDVEEWGDAVDVPEPPDDTPTSAVTWGELKREF